MTWGRTLILFPVIQPNSDCCLLADPKLTALGIQQAQAVNKAWIAESKFNIPLPQSLYTSPFTRAVHTAMITFDGILINTPSNEGRKRPIIKEVRFIWNQTHS